MPALRPLLLLAALGLGAGPALAANAAGGAVGVVPADAPETVVYVFPTSPQTFVPHTGLPSFLFMPGAPLPAIATQVVYTTTLPVPTAPVVVAGDLDCSDIVGTVAAPAPDLYDLDRDGDGIGCEPEDR